MQFRSASSHFQHFLCWGLIIAGVGLIGVGIHQELNPHPVISSAERYLSALKNGEKEQLLQELSPETQKHWREAHPGSISSHPELDFQIHSVDIQSISATVKLKIQHDKLTAHPVLHFRQHNDGHWRITAIDNLSPNAQLQRAMAIQKMRADEQLSEELKKQVAGRPGVEVIR